MEKLKPARETAWIYEEEMVTAKYEKEQTAKCEKNQSDKTHKAKVRKPTNEGASTECKVEAAEGSTEAGRKDDNGCTEVRNREEVTALL